MQIIATNSGLTKTISDNYNPVGVSARIIKENLPFNFE
jgi:hypothetical protein